MSGFRRVHLASAEVLHRVDARGRAFLRAARPLGPHPPRLTDRFVLWAEQAPERTFVARRDAGGAWRHVSYALALQLARVLGSELLKHGLSPERPLAILSENDLEHAMLALAALHVGVPFVAISPAYSLASRDHAKLRGVLAHLTPGLVFVSDGEPYAAAIEAAVPREMPMLFARRPTRPDTVSFEAWAARGAEDSAVDRARAAVTPETIAKYLLTSGSAGLPKAVVHTQRMLASNQQMLVECLPFLAEEPPVLVDWLPWNHTFGGNHNFGIALYNGGTLYIDDGKPTPALMSETLRNLREISPTVYFNVPRGFEELTHALERDDALARSFFARVKMLFYAGASLSQPIWDALHRIAERTVGERIVMITGLGMTETSPFAICAHWEAGRAGGIGLPVPGVDLALVPVGDKLEARYRGPNVTPGYHRDPDRTREAFDEDGYFRSGDAVRFVDAVDPLRGLLFDGRVGEDFKLDTGTWVSVGSLRARIVALGEPYVQDAVITGHDRRELGALVFPRIDRLRALCRDLPADAPPERLLVAPEVRACFAALLAELEREATGSASRIARLLLLAEPPSLDRGEVTDKGSINQRAVLDARAELVAALHSPGAASDPRVVC